MDDKTKNEKQEIRQRMADLKALRDGELEQKAMRNKPDEKLMERRG
jgi:hypothetical protein